MSAKSWETSIEDILRMNISQRKRKKSRRQSRLRMTNWESRVLSLLAHKKKSKRCWHRRLPKRRRLLKHLLNHWKKDLPKRKPQHLLFWARVISNLYLPLKLIWVKVIFWGCTSRTGLNLTSSSVAKWWVTFRLNVPCMPKRSSLRSFRQ